MIRNSPKAWKEMRMGIAVNILLGQGNATHMHWHIFPRRDGDTPEKGPVWKLPKSVMYDEANRPRPEELDEMKKRLRAELELLFRP